MQKNGIASALDAILDNFFLVQKNLDHVSGLYNTIVLEAESAVIRRVLRATDRNKKKSAKILGISRTTLNSKIKALSIEE